MDSIRCRAYPTDLTDEQWDLAQIAHPEAKPGGRRPRSTRLREVLYLNRSGCQWDEYIRTTPEAFIQLLGHDIGRIGVIHGTLTR